MSKHTPGPWGSFRNWIVTVNADGSIPLNARIVADENGFATDEDRLLACAAPDLLAAAKSARNLLWEIASEVEDGVRTLNQDSPEGKAWAALANAIAKAEGATNA